MATDTGTPWSVPYPETTDAPDGPTQLGNMASTVHGLLGSAYPCTSGARPAHTAGLLIYETDTDLLQVSDGAAWNVVNRQDVGAVTSGFTAQTGWSNSGCSYRLIGPLAYIHISCTRTGSDLTSNASTGNVADSPVVALPSAITLGTGDWIWGMGTMSGTHGFTWRLPGDSSILTLVSSYSLGVTLTSGDYVLADFFTVP